jgi:HK97 family phage major capsid protein/HK97 family phage prohead protease
LEGHEFVLSDETPDRMGDIVEAAGWDFLSFQKNPIALFAHRPDFAIGTWSDVRIDGQTVRGHLKLAPKGTSARIDEIRKLVDAGILRAVSVGFKPIDSVPLNPKDPWGGMRFTKQELVECSLVAVPANPNALMTAKTLKVSDDTLKLVFAKHGKENKTITRAVIPGGKAKQVVPSRTSIMTPLTKRIADAQERIKALREGLVAHLEKVDDSNVTDDDLAVTNEFNAKIEQEEKGLASLLASERHLAAAAAADSSNVTTVPASARSTPRPFALPAKKVDPIDFLVRAITVQAFAHTNRLNIEVARERIAAVNQQYGDEATKVYTDWIGRAAANPAMTTVTGWAAELVQTVYAAFMQSLMPLSVFPRLSAKGLDLSFGRAGKISIPTRALTPTIAGSFVGEGQPIPVRQGVFTAQVITPKKLGVITTFTREMDEHSIPAIEAVLRQAVQEDTAVAIDTVLLDANPATVIRPPGLLNGVTPITATAGGGFTALVGDIKALTGALLTATRGNVRNPVWIMNPQQVNSAGLTPAPASGVFPFKPVDGKLNNWPIIDSGTVPLGTMIAMDAADFVSAGEAPRFEVSDQATLHEEDTTPLPIVGAGSPGTVASPVRSLFQTDSLALRLVQPMNWMNRRTGVVQVIQGVTW